MKLRMLGPVLVAGVAIGVLLFLIGRTQAVDNDLHLERLRRIQTVGSLDLQLNRAMQLERVSSLSNLGEERTRVTEESGPALDAIDKDAKGLRGLTPELDKALDVFLDSIQSKFELAFDFEARNTLLTQRMVNGMDGVPLRADELVAAADPKVREDVRGLVAQLKTEVLGFGAVDTPSNADALNGVRKQLADLGATQPQKFRAALTALDDLVDEVYKDKSELVQRFQEFLARPTFQQLRTVEQAYTDWHSAQVATANGYRLLLAGYAALLLVGLGVLGVRLARSFRDLDRANAELTNANEHLEDQVQLRTKDLSTALDDLKASQAQLIQSEKMASLGQMVAGVAHEINTPLGYARSNTEIVRNSLAELRSLLSAQDKALGLMLSPDAAEEQVAQALDEAQQKRESVNAEELAGDLDSLLADADHGLTHIGELVGTLKDFSRVDRSRSDLFNLNDGLDSALKIAHNQLKYRVEVVRNYGKLPQIECSPSQLNQVFLNLLTNAAQAIGDKGEDKGKIYIHTAAENDGVVVRILDTGCGMSEEVKARIFEPFFTTKPVGKGTGLGLSIVYRIVEDHGGRIEVRSLPGKGSEFVVHLPLRQKEAIPAVAAEPVAEPALAA